MRFLVAGGLTVNLHGVPRMTADIDIAVDFSAGNIGRLLEALGELGYSPAVPVRPTAFADGQQREEWRDSEKHASVFLRQCLESTGRSRCLTRISGF